MQSAVIHNNGWLNGNGHPMDTSKNEVTNSQQSEMQPMLSEVRRTNDARTDQSASTPQQSSITDQESADARESCTLEQLVEDTGLQPKFLKERGLQTITYPDRRRAVRIPYRDAEGKGCGARSVFRTKTGGRAFEWTKGTRPSLYGRDVLPQAREAGVVLLTSSEFETLAALSEGEMAVAVPQGEEWQEEWADELEGIATIKVSNAPEALIEQLSRSSVADRVWIKDGQRSRKLVPEMQSPEEPFAPEIQDEQTQEEPVMDNKGEDVMTEFRPSIGQQMQSPTPNVPELASAPDILQRVAERLEAMGIVSAQKQVKVTYLTIISRLLPKPASLVIKGDSSVGKSYPTEQVLRLFSRGEVVRMGKGSEKNLFYKGSLAHRVLYFPEATRIDEEQSEVLRILLSEARYDYHTTEELCCMNSHDYGRGVSLEV